MVLPVKNIDPHALDIYFKARTKLEIIKHNHQIYAKLREFIFLLPFPYGILELVETFYEDHYGDFNVSGGIVVDVGAFIGDTAIFFAGKGAKQVIAFEPAPPLYEIAVKNVQMNKLDNIITVKNEAVGEKYGEVMLNYERSWPGLSSTFFTSRKVSSSYYRVKVIPLSDIIFELGQVDLLKIDCEGCEHRILLHAYKSGVLKNVSSIIVEIHGNPYVILGLLSKSSYTIVKKVSYGKFLHLIHACKKDILKMF